jgi:branched-chain amino acid aminotransferase
MHVWLNNEILDESEAHVSIKDTGLLHAAGVFTTMRSYGGKVFRMDLHLRRLRHSCEALFIPLQYKDEVLTAATEELLRRNELQNARLRLTVTRGTAEQDPLHGTRLSPTTFITATEFEPYPREFYERGQTVILLDDQKLNPYDLQAGHKTLNYLSRLNALKSATQRGAGEALWFNVHNSLQSGSISNVFMVKNGELLTPPTQQELNDPAVAQTIVYPKSATLPGVTRQVVIDLAKANQIAVRPAAIDVNQLLEADEIFLTNSIMGIMPVTRIERKPVASEKPGRMTELLAALYAGDVEHLNR